MIVKEKIEVKEITHNDKIPYVWKTHNFGRAEFQICPVFKRGKMTDLYLYRRQQETYDGYHIDIMKCLPDSKIDEFEIESLAYFEKPNIWRNFWCKEHKTIAFETYVSPNTNTIEFSYHFGNNLTIRFADRPTAPLQPKQISRSEVQLNVKEETVSKQ